MDTDGVMQWFILVILLFFSAFFSSAETALTTVNKLHLRTLVEEGNKRAATVTRLLDERSKMLSAILVANNVINISASAIATSLAIRLWGNASVGLMTGALTLAILVFGEITPKNLATLYPEKISLLYAPVILVVMKLLVPAIFIIDKLSSGILRLLRIDLSAIDSAMTENELRTIVDVSHEDGVIEKEERQMIYNVFDFGDSLAKDIMIPRVDMSCVSIDAAWEELREVFLEEKYTRLPVYEETTDNIVGLVNIKDILFYEDLQNFHIRNIMREASFTFEYKRTSELMLEMRENSISMVMVLDEYGATAGLITLEDLLEEIVGEIRDEFDEDEQNYIQEIGDHEYLIEGSMKLDDINDALELSDELLLDSEDYDSIGGLIIEKLDRLPEAGETVELDNGIILQVAKMDKTRIDKVLMRVKQQSENENENDSENENEEK
ncbi:MAG: HlyC/CorC family transporter [Clostridia bacterium]|nr:HlyC/CorC family transporter [Clostridia bacterium]